MAFRSFGRAGVCADTGINGHVRAELLAVNKSARWRRWSKAGAFGLPALLSAAFMTQTVSAADAEASDRRQIEEVVVTAERKESTVSDTSISITAFTGQMLEDFGIRNQEDLQKYIPAAVIEPYDMAIRGIGRNFRALGGDPGIATYLNGVYSEDFGIASTEGGLFDIERIEVLRGPQGTLYGRNAIGGAVNFINRLPSNEFEGVARVVAGNYDLVEQYGVLSGPLIENILQARIVGTKRTRDGYIDDKSGNQNPDNYGDENYALSLRWTPTDNLEFNTRGNERSYRRRMGGADAAGIVNLTENGGTVDPVTGNKRNTSSFAMGYRAGGHRGRVPEPRRSNEPRVYRHRRHCQRRLSARRHHRLQLHRSCNRCGCNRSARHPRRRLRHRRREPDQQPGVRHEPGAAEDAG